MRKINAGLILQLFLCAGYGALVGYLAITSAELPPGKVSNREYQNFGLIAGAAIGLGVYLLGKLIYRYMKKRVQSHREGFIYAVSIASGAAIGFLSSFIVHISAGSFGLINAGATVIIVGSLLPAFIGALIPAVGLMFIRP